MEVNLKPELRERLSRVAAERGQNAEELVAEAVERMLSYDEWFHREDEKGLRSADRGEFVSHEEVWKMIERRYPS